MPIILLFLLLMLINVPVIGTIIAGIFAFWLIAEGLCMFISCFTSGKN